MRSQYNTFYLIFSWNIPHIFSNIIERNELQLQSSHLIHCPEHFTAVGDTCYYLSSSPGYLSTANHTCLRMNGFLAAIETPEENGRLYEWLSESYEWSEWFLGPYIGLYRYDLTSSDFQWINPASRWSTYRNWEGGAPSIVAGTDNCVVMTNIEATWYNYYCDALLQYVCEAYPVTPTPTHQPVFAPTYRPSKSPTLRPSFIPTATTSPTPSGNHKGHPHTHAPTIATYECPDGFSSIHSTCYTFMATPGTFEQANLSCTNQNGWLVTIDSEIEDQALLLWLQSIPGIIRSAHDGSGPFIGLYRNPFDKDFTTDSFHWINHHSNRATSSAYMDWALNYPLFDQSSSAQTNNCVVISMESGWMNVDCSSTHQFICETFLIPTESTGAPNDDLAILHEKENMLWSLFVPLTFLAGGLLFYCCMKYKSSTKRPGPDHQYLPQEDSEHISSTHALVNDTRSQNLHSSTTQNGKYLSKYNYSDNSSPEETMEIQLQMRSYAPLTQNSV